MASERNSVVDNEFAVPTVVVQSTSNSNLRKSASKSSNNISSSEELSSSSKQKSAPNPLVKVLEKTKEQVEFLILGKERLQSELDAIKDKLTASLKLGQSLDDKLRESCLEVKKLSFENKELVLAKSLLENQCRLSLESNSNLTSQLSSSLNEVTQKAAQVEFLKICLSKINEEIANRDVEGE